MSRFKTRARMRARNAELRAAQNAAPKAAKATIARQRGAYRERARTVVTTSPWRIGMNVALLAVSLGGAALQLIESSRHVPGEHRLWLSVYLFVAVFAAYSLSQRLKARRDQQNGVVPKARRAG